jgi:hypothetical protein
VLSAKRQAIFGFAAIFLLATLIVLAFTPHLFDSHAGMRQNESAAVGSLRRIHDLETKYAASHPNEGFACELQQLRSVENVTSTYPTNALLLGEWSGYKFLIECSPTEKRIILRYQVTAVPSAPGVTGVRAFCADESGTVFYAENGSATECLSSRIALF